MHMIVFILRVPMSCTNAGRHGRGRRRSERRRPFLGDGRQAARRNHWSSDPDSSCCETSSSLDSRVNDSDDHHHHECCSEQAGSGSSGSSGCCISISLVHCGSDHRAKDCPRRPGSVQADCPCILISIIRIIICGSPVPNAASARDCLCPRARPPAPVRPPDAARADGPAAAASAGRTVAGTRQMPSIINTNHGQRL